nr:rho guanine nucleotide exchange factor-like protein [Plectrocnemia conspersa]
MSVGKLEGAGSKVEQLCVTVLKDEKGYGMTVSGNDPVIVQSVVKHGAAWRAGVRYGDRLLQVNNIAVEKSMHHDVVEMIKSSANAVLVLQRTVSMSKVTAPLPVDRERQRQVEYTKIQTFRMMLEDENRYKESLQSLLAHSPTEKNIKDLEAAETRIAQLKDKIANASQSSFIVKDPQALFIQDPPATPPRQPLVSNIPRSLTGLTGQSLRSNRHSQILPQTNLIGHQRSRSSPEQLGHFNNTNESKDWELVVTPPGTPPPPYPVSPHGHLPIDPQKDIMSMEEDESSTPIIQSQYCFGGFDKVANLSISRIAVFLNWIAGERRPPQAALLYLLSTAYSTGPFSSLPRWAYELHSIFLVPGAPLALSNVDENMAREIDDILINESEKEDVLRKIFTKARDKAEEELNQQLQDFQIKRQSGLGSFYGPADAVLENCSYNRTQETHVIVSWLMPRLNTWIEESLGEPWGATYGSPLSAVLAAAILPLLQHTFGFKTQHINNILGTPPAGTPPRPSFLQRDKQYKQRIKFLNKSNAHSLSLRGHHLTAIAVTSVCHCNQCHMLIYGIAPQAYHCSDCRLRVHRSCVKRIEEPCCGPPAAATRISRIMEKLAPSPGIMPTSNSHQHIDSNQHVHHHHDKKPRKSLGTAGFLNMERSFRKTEEEIHANLDNNLSQSFSAGDGKIGTEDGADGAPHIPEVWDKSFDHSADRAEGSHGGVRQRPVIRAESYRDKATKVHRTKRKTSDPNQLTSGNAYNDAEATGNIGAPSGGSSSSSLSSRSNESAAGQPENQDSHSEWSDEEDSAEPWSTKASAEVLVNMSMKERKRQDLIHELITTEISHVRWLRILRRVFLSPLQRTNLLPASELKALFPNLPEVLQRHRKLSADLKTLAATAPVVKTKPLAEALINTLGEPKYPVALAKFCGGQRLALDVLRDRQKRNKELYNFIAKREQEPLCARKRLQDFLACVWQRLTKYQLLLEGISKTITDEDESDPDKEEAVTKIAHALDLAKDILHTVDTAIKTTENDHRLKTIQSKLEVRGVGTESEPGELRRLDLVRHSLVIEGSLLIRQDSTKRLTVHALMLSECLVLLQKESDKYILRPISQVGHQPLSPVVHWNTVFFRTNAAAKNGFFLVNINGVGMYDMSVNNSTEYNTWIRHISEAAKALGPRSNTVEEGPPPPLPSNPPPVTATNTEEPPESSEPNTSVDEEKDEPPIVNEDDGTIVSGATRLIEGETDDSRRPNKFVEEELTKLSSVDIISPPPTLTAYRQLTAEERLRQAEEKVKLALQEAAEAAKDVAESSPSIYSSAMESLLGKMPIDKQWKTSIGNGLNSTAENDRKSSKDLLLTAQSHVNTLTEVLFKALRVSSVGSDCAMTKCSVSPSHGFCDSCFSKHAKFIKTAKHDSFGKGDGSSRPENDLTEKTNNSDQKSDEQNNGKFDSFVMLEEPGESSTDPGEETDLNLVTTSSLGLREILSTLLQRLPAEERERELLRSRLQQADSRLHYLHHVHRDCVHADGEMEKDSLQEVPDFISNDKSSEG